MRKINKELLTKIIFGIAITALVGGFLLGFFSKKQDEEAEATKIHEYTVENNSDEVNNHEERAVDVENEDPEELGLIEKTKVEVEEKIEEEQEHEHEHEEAQTVFGIYKDKYSEKLIDRAIEIAHDTSYKLSDQGGSYEDWEKYSTKKLLNSLVDGDKNSLLFDSELIGVNIVPIESDYDGIALGSYLETQSGVALLEYDFVVNKNEVLLDDMKLLWSH